jgi:sugar phosphate isomerase/epimerase
MENINRLSDKLSRRRFVGLSALAGAYAAIPGLSPVFFEQGKPNSTIGGVQVGAITYSWRSMPGTAEDILKYCTQCGISTIELMGDVAESYAGIPKSPAKPAQGKTLSDSEKKAIETEAKAFAEKQMNWRLAAPMDKFKELRKMYNNAGVDIHIVKFSPENWTDKEIDYSFKAAKALGAKGVCNEIGDNAVKRISPAAQKNGLYAIFHQHLQPGEPGWTFEKFLEYSPAAMLNFDAGHYFGATGLHPNGIIEKLHDRIVSIHMKDKTGPKGNPPNTNMPWGKGETPIADILLLLKKNKWPIYADIELEYPVPEGSDAVQEVKKCVDFCRKILA